MDYATARRRMVSMGRPDQTGGLSPGHRFYSAVRQAHMAPNGFSKSDKLIFLPLNIKLFSPVQLDKLQITPEAHSFAANHHDAFNAIDRAGKPDGFGDVTGPRNTIGHRRGGGIRKCAMACRYTNGVGTPAAEGVPYRPRGCAYRKRFLLRFQAQSGAHAQRGSPGI